MKNLFFLLIICFLLSSCNQPSNFESGNTEKFVMKNITVEPPPYTFEKQDNFKDVDTAQIPIPPKPSQPKLPKTKEEDNIFQFVQQKPIPKIDSLLIKKGFVQFQVESLEKSVELLKKAIQEFSGYISTSTDTRSDYELRTEIIIRVPNTKFEGLLNELLKQSVFLENKNIETEDVTEEFIDAYARIKAKREVENRYLSILQQAKTVEEILKVEEQLRVIREEIEVKQGRLKYLKDQINYSTIRLVVHEKLPYKKDAEIGFFTRLGQSFSQGWDNFQYFIIGLVGLWWFWILLFAVIYFVRKWILKIRVRRDSIKKTIQKTDNTDSKSQS